MVGVWEGLNLGFIPNFFLCFGMHPKIIDVHPKLIPKGGVVQFCQKDAVQYDESSFYLLTLANFCFSNSRLLAAILNIRRETLQRIN